MLGQAPFSYFLSFYLFCLFNHLFYHLSLHDRLLSLGCRGETLLGGADRDFYNWENFQGVNYFNFSPLYTKTVQNHKVVYLTVASDKVQ